MRLFIICFFTVICFGRAKAAPAEVELLWVSANTAYVNSNYDEAIELYDSIYHAGYSSHELFYNLGNAYFKVDNIGKAILYYSRAEAIIPTDEDTKHNMAVVSNYVKDKIDPIPELFIEKWFGLLRMNLASNGWAIISLIALSMSLSFVILYLLSKNLPRRKVGFFGALGLFFVFVFSTSWSISERSKVVDPKIAVVMSSMASVKSSPDASSKDLFTLHEGTKVKIISSLNDWSEIVIADGNKGWVLDDRIQTIHSVSK